MLTKLKLMGTHSKIMVASDIEVGERQEQLTPEKLAMLISVKTDNRFFMKIKYMLLMNWNICDYSIMHRYSNFEDAIEFNMIFIDEIQKFHRIGSILHLLQLPLK